MLHNVNNSTEITKKKKKKRLQRFIGKKHHNKDGRNVSSFSWWEYDAKIRTWKTSEIIT